MPIAPGTFGSAAGLLVWWLLAASADAAGRRDRRRSSSPASWSGSVAERHFGRTDPGQVVIDEVMGMLDHAVPQSRSAGPARSPAFLLFRVADVIKPYPANRLEQLHGGLGVMADDCDGRRLREPGAARMLASGIG